MSGVNYAVIARITTSGRRAGPIFAAHEPPSAAGRVVFLHLANVLDVDWALARWAASPSRALPGPCDGKFAAARELAPAGPHAALIERWARDKHENVTERIALGSMSPLADRLKKSACGKLRPQQERGDEALVDRFVPLNIAQPLSLKPSRKRT